MCLYQFTAPSKCSDSDWQFENCQNCNPHRVKQISRASAERKVLGHAVDSDYTPRGTPVFYRLVSLLICHIT